MSGENQIATVEQPHESPTKALALHLRSVQPHLEKLLPNPERFGVTLIVAARRTPDLLRCDMGSVIGAALVCAQLNLEPGPAEHVWLIPRWNSVTKTNDCTLMLGYKGMKALAERHPAISSVRTGTVYAGDEFHYTAQPPELRHTPSFGEDRGEARLWYAVAHRADGQPPHIAVLDKAAVEARRKRSSAANRGPWVEHYDAMARKSAIRALWAELPSSLDMQRAAQIDDSEGVINPLDLGLPQQALPGAADVARSAAEIAATVEVDEPEGGEGDVTPGRAGGSVLPSPEVERPEAPAPAERQEDGPATPHAASDLASAKQRQRLAIMAGELTWDRNTRLYRAASVLERSVGSFTELSRDEAKRLEKAWAPLVASWRANRASRLLSAGLARGHDEHAINSVCISRFAKPLAELDAQKIQTLIDELEEAVGDTSGGGAASPSPASTGAQKAEIVDDESERMSLLERVDRASTQAIPMPRAREMYLAGVCKGEDVETVGDLPVAALRKLADALEELAATRGAGGGSAS